MAEKVNKTGVTKEAGYLYYLGKDGHVWRTKMARGGKKTGGGPEKVADAGVTSEDKFLYLSLIHISEPKRIYAS